MDELLRQHPELLSQLMSLSGMEQQDQDYQEQLAQAEALRQAGPERHSAVGGALQGAADMLNAWTSKNRQADIRNKRQALWDKMGATRGAIGSAYGAQPAQPDPIPYDQAPKFETAEGWSAPDFLARR